MIYFNTSGDKKTGYCIFFRDSNAVNQFLSTMYVGNGSKNRPQSWKTEPGAIRAIKRILPEWIYETTEEYRTRKEIIKTQE